MLRVTVSIENRGAVRPKALVNTDRISVVESIVCSNHSLDEGESCTDGPQGKSGLTNFRNRDFEKARVTSPASSDVARQVVVL